MHNTLTAAVTATLLATAGMMAQAHEAGDIILRAGFATVSPNDESDRISLPTASPTVLPAGVSVDDDTQLGLMGTWMFADTWGLELLAATPYEHQLSLPDLGIDAGSTKHLPPTLSMQWYPRGGMPGWQPYLGLGLNYTHFFDETVDAQLSGALGEVLGASSARLELEDSFGLAGQAGVDLPLNDRWMLNAAVWYIDLGTEADIVTDVGTVSFDVDIDPWVFNIGVAYKF